ncbi:MAG TPA: FtsX-like permease family protein, partial [Vicinamibacterales bacterium]
PGVTADVARSRLALDARRLAVAYPDTRRGARVTLRLHGYLNESPVEILTMVAILLSLPLTVLLIGCANVANLQLARATDRGRELSVRFALGASRPQLIRLLTAESAILAILSTGAGWLGSHFILSIAQPAFQVTLTLDRRVFGFAVGLAAGVTLLSGLAPAWWSTRRQTVAVKQAGRAGGPAHSRLRHALVIVQIALSLSLLAISGLFMTSLRATRQEVPPFARNTLVASLDVDTLGYTTAETRRLREEVMVRLASHPLVASLAAEQMAGFRYWAAGDPVQTIQHAAGGYVTPSWFATTGARLVAGRQLAASDSTTTVAVINERLAQQISPDGAAPGTILYLSNSVISSQSRNRIELTRPLPGQQADGPDTRFAVEVVGVVADVPRRPGAAEAVPAVYLPFPADAGGQFTLRVRAPDPEAMAPQIRDVIRRAEPRLVAIEISSAEAVFLREIGALGTVAWSIGGLGLVALGLAAAGLYAVMAFLVSLRRQEFGIRLAMGARPGDVLQLILRQGFRLALAGSLAGFAIALLVALTLRASFVGMSPFDPAAMLPPAAVLMVVTLLASAVPARRASRIDPIRALREE